MSELKGSVIVNSIAVRELRPDDFMVNRLNVYLAYDKEESVSDIDGKRYGPGYRVIVSPERVRVSTCKNVGASGRVKQKGDCRPMVHTIYESGRFMNKRFNSLRNGNQLLRTQKALLEKIVKKARLEPKSRPQQAA